MASLGQGSSQSSPHTHTHTPLSSEGWCCSWQVISGIDHEQYIEIATLCLNEGSSRLGVHKDMGTPMPALCMGPGLWRLAGGEWRPTGEGGQLYLADGMFDVSYGPCGGTLLDGNLLHGVTNLRDFSGTGQTSRPELERFSLIIFSNWKRAPGMRNVFEYQWCEGDRSGLVWK